MLDENTARKNMNLDEFARYEILKPLWKPSFIPSKKIIVSLGEHGKVQFGVQTQYLISKYENFLAL